MAVKAHAQNWNPSTSPRRTSVCWADSEAP